MPGLEYDDYEMGNMTDVEMMEAEVNINIDNDDDDDDDDYDDVDVDNDDGYGDDDADDGDDGSIPKEMKHAGPLKRLSSFCCSGKIVRACPKLGKWYEQ